MQLEDYFEFETCETELGPVERIRVRGCRIAIENIVLPYKEGVSPEGILRDYYPSLALEEIYATILYYLVNRAKVEAYLQSDMAFEDAFAAKHLKAGPSAVRRKIEEARARLGNSLVNAHG